MGDQATSVQTLLETSGELQNLPYHVTWSEFPSGAAGIAALTGGSVDVVPTADAPAIFAYAAHDPIKVISASLPSTPSQSIYGLLVPGNSTIDSLASLAGKKVGWQTGSVGQYFGLQALKQAGVPASSVTFVNLTAGSALSALNGGKVDALFSSDPFMSIGVADFHDKVVVSGASYVKGETFWIASSSALASPSVSAAIGDMVGRYAKAQIWAAAHRSQWAATFSRITGLPAAVADLYVNRSQYVTVPITAANIITPLQNEADFFYQQKVLTAPVHLTALFDTRFNKQA
ncbi:MAG: transporter substrate-binding domain-containing protein [Acidobacteriota bacterium]|nr:transporter substrate-binding domain-containing protein [Acidobacteriota bacterium]